MLVICSTAISIASLIVMIIKGYTGGNFISYTYPLCSEYLILKYGHSNSTVYIICFSFSIIKIFFNLVWFLIYLFAKDQKLSQQDNKIQNRNLSELEIKKYMLLLANTNSLLSTIVVAGHHNSFLVDLQNCEGSHPNEWTLICAFSYIQLLSFIIYIILLHLDYHVKRDQPQLNLLDEQTLKQKFNIFDLSHQKEIKNNESILSKQKFNQGNQKINKQPNNQNKFLEILYTCQRQVEPTLIARQNFKNQQVNQNTFLINKMYNSNKINAISNCQNHRNQSTNNQKGPIKKQRKYLQNSQIIIDSKFLQNSNDFFNPFQKLILQDQQKSKALREFFDGFYLREEQQLKKKKDQKWEDFGKPSARQKDLVMKQSKSNNFDVMQKLVLNLLKDKFQDQP